MLIYATDSSINRSFGPTATSVDYKNAGTRKRCSIRAENSKLNTRHQHSSHKTKKKKDKTKELNARNVKFLTSLGFQVGSRKKSC